MVEALFELSDGDELRPRSGLLFMVALLDLTSLILITIGVPFLPDKMR